MPAPAKPLDIVEALVERSQVEGRLSLDQLRAAFDEAGVKSAEADAMLRSLTDAGVVLDTGEAKPAKAGRRTAAAKGKAADRPAARPAAKQATRPAGRTVADAAAEAPEGDTVFPEPAEPAAATPAPADDEAAPIALDEAPPGID